VNSTDANGATALHKAAWEAATDVVSLLLERGADPNIRERGGYRAIDFCWQPSQGRIYERLRDVTAGD
jgi:ankyrin repeat protein